MTPGTAPRTSTDPSARDLWRAARGPVVVAGVVLVAGLLLALATGGGGSPRLDPGSAAPGGARAVAELLDDQGVQVDLVTTSAGAARAAAGGDTLLVVDPDLLADRQVEAARGTGADLVLVSTTLPERWVPGARAVPADPGVRGPGCRLAAAQRAGRADSGAVAYDVDGSALAGGDRCYSRDGRPSLVQGSTDGQRVTLLGTGSPLTNERLDDEGNAALAVGLLGGTDRLVWYLPSASDVPEGAQQSLYSLVPEGVWWGLGQLAVAVLVLALWRARRLGPVVAEPLPVLVRAAETVEGRGRLYRRAGARDRAGQALRVAALARLVPALGLPRRAEPAAVVAAVSGRSSRPSPDVATLLYGAAPADDAALVRLADDLDDLEREVGRP